MDIYAQTRFSIRRSISLECKVLRARDLALVGARTLDVSTSGMLIQELEPAMLREPVLVSFRAPGLSRTFITDARVTRIIQGRRPKDRGRCLGLQFLDFDPLSRLLLRSQLKKVPPPLPSRQKRVDYARAVRLIDGGTW